MKCFNCAKFIEEGEIRVFEKKRVWCLKCWDQYVDGLLVFEEGNSLWDQYKDLEYYPDRRCACGCGGNIMVRPWHKYGGIPRFIKGHASGWSWSEESKQKVRGENNHAKKPEVGEKISTSLHLLYGNGYVNSMQGNHHTEEAKDKMRKTIEDNGGHFKEDNSNWKGGLSLSLYPSEFGKIRKQIKGRDSFQCQRCGKLEIDEIKDTRKGLTVHHIDYCKDNNQEDNLITLCKSCNGKVNANRNYWTKFFQWKLKELKCEVV